MDALMVGVGIIMLIMMIPAVIAQVVRPTTNQWGTEPISSFWVRASVRFLWCVAFIVICYALYFLCLIFMGL